MANNSKKLKTTNVDSSVIVCSNRNRPALVRDLLRAIFDRNSKEIRDAFEIQINFLNKNEDKHADIHIEAEIQELDATDSFALSNAICALLKDGVYGIIGVSNASALSTIQSYSNKFQVPFIALSMAQNSTNGSPFQLFMRPMYTKGILDVITSYAWSKILYVYDTDEGLIRLQQLFQAVNIGEITLDIDVKRVTDIYDAYYMLKDLHLKEDKENQRVFLDLATKKAEEIIVRIKNDSEIQNHKFHFLLGELGIEEMSLTQFKNGGINITGFQLVNQTSKYVERFKQRWQKDVRTGPSNKSRIKFESALVVDAVDLFYRALKEVSHSRRFSNTRKPRIQNFKCTDSSYVSPHNGTEMMTSLKKVEFSGITGKISFDDRGHRKEFKLQLMDITVNMGLATVGVWTREEGLEIHEARRRHRKNEGQELPNKKKIVTTIIEPPYMMYKDEATELLAPKCGKDNFIGFCAELAEKLAKEANFTYELCLVGDKMYGSKQDNGTWNGMIGELVRKENPYMMYKDDETEARAEREKERTGKPICGNHLFKGFCAELAERVAKSVNFTYEICLVKDGKYGAVNENESWNGMVGELTRGEVDLAIAPMSISSQRERVVDFTKPYMSLGISIMIKKTALKKASVFSFMDPLSYEIWMCILFAYIGVSVVLFLVSRFSPTEWHVDEGTTITNDFTISNSLWYSLGAFMQQGCDISPRSVSGRIVGSVWWFFTLIIISSYTANLAAFLTVERMLTPIESAEDLAKQTEIQYGTLSSGSTQTFFKQSKVAVYQRMWAYMQSASPSVFVGSNEEGIDRVRDGNYAFLIESTTNDYNNMRDPCNTMKVGTNLDSKGYGIATPAGSDLRDRLTLAVLKLRELGDLESMKKKWWENMSECPLQSSTGDGGQTELNLWNVAGIFYILVGGLVLSVVIACIEFIYKSKIDSKRSKTSFGSVLRCKARLSFRGSLDRDNPSSNTPLRNSMSTYTYTGPTPMVGADGYRDNTHTQV